MINAAKVFIFCVSILLSFRTNAQIVGFLGVNMQPLPRGGFLITEVVLNSPVYGIGVRSGDVITHLDGVPLYPSLIYSFKNYIISHPGKLVSLTILRDGMVARMAVRLGRIDLAAASPAEEDIEERDARGYRQISRDGQNNTNGSNIQNSGTIIIFK